MSEIPVFPVREIEMRWNARRSKFYPTSSGGTLLVNVDALGRPVIGVYRSTSFNDRELAGWRLSNASPMLDTEDVREFLEREAQRRRRKRT